MGKQQLTNIYIEGIAIWIRTTLKLSSVVYGWGNKCEDTSIMAKLRVLPEQKFAAGCFFCGTSYII